MNENKEVLEDAHTEVENLITTINDPLVAFNIDYIIKKLKTIQHKIEQAKATEEEKND